MKAFIKSLKLLVPAILPSWNFFDIITASPRVQYVLKDACNRDITQWREFRPRPPHLSPLQVLKRMFWNERWNEAMFVMGCAERLMTSPTEHSEIQIMKRIIMDLPTTHSSEEINRAKFVQFRLLYIDRRYDLLDNEVTYHSRLCQLNNSNNQ